MSYFKIEKNSNYTVMSNYHLRDKKISYKAKGLLSFMLSLPEDWDYSVNGLVAVSKEGIKAIRNILKELQNNGYLKIEKKQNEYGQFEYNYLIFECPDTQKGDMDLGDVEKGIQINTNNKEDKDDKSDLSSFFIPEEHNRLTINLIDNDYISMNDIHLIEYDELFNELLQNNISYGNIIKVSNYIADRVIKRDFMDEDDNLIKDKFNYFKNAIYNNINRLYSENKNWWFEEDFDDNIKNIHNR